MDKTRILVTHALHFLPHVDYIYVLSDGFIAEQGTYTELINSGKEFSRFLNEFISKDNEETEKQATRVKSENDKEKARKKSTGKGLMQIEERNTGAISWEVYKEYMKAGHGIIIVPMLILSMILIQTSTVMSSYW